MITIKIDNNLNQLSARLADMARQIPFSTAVALNRTADKVVAAEVREMRDVFDRPTPYTLSGVTTTRANKGNLSAIVKLKDFAGKGTPAAKFLAAQITGGNRAAKRFEIALQNVGALPAGYRVVPGTACKMDQYGNIDRGQIVQILSYFKAFPEMGYKANMTDRRKAQLARGSKTQAGFAYFVGQPGDRLPLGVWQRFRFAHGSSIKPVLIFVKSVHYRAIFDFNYVGKMVVEREFDGEFSRAFADSLKGR